MPTQPDPNGPASDGEVTNIGSGSFNFGQLPNTTGEVTLFLDTGNDTTLRTYRVGAGENAVQFTGRIINDLRALGYTVRVDAAGLNFEVTGRPNDQGVFQRVQGIGLQVLSRDGEQLGGIDADGRPTGVQPTIVSGTSFGYYGLDQATGDWVPVVRRSGS